MILLKRDPATASFEHTLSEAAAITEGAERPQQVEWGICNGVLA